MIGELAEGPLHAALKRLYAEPGDEVEAARCGCVVDIARAWGEVVEIQTRGFGRLRLCHQRQSGFMKFHVLG